MTKRYILKSDKDLRSLFANLMPPQANSHAATRRLLKIADFLDENELNAGDVITVKCKSWGSAPARYQGMTGIPLAISGDDTYWLSEKTRDDKINDAYARLLDACKCLLTNMPKVSKDNIMTIASLVGHDINVIEE